VARLKRIKIWNLSVPSAGSFVADVIWTPLTVPSVVGQIPDATVRDFAGAKEWAKVGWSYNHEWTSKVFDVADSTQYAGNFSSSITSQNFYFQVDLDWRPISQTP